MAVGVLGGLPSGTSPQGRLVTAVPIGIHDTLVLEDKRSLETC